MKKKFNLLFMLLATTMFVFSCDKDEPKEQKEDDPIVEPTPDPEPEPSAWEGKTVSIKAAVEAIQGLDLKWAADDAIKLFDADAVGVDFTNTSGADATGTFSTTAWTGKKPLYAVHTTGAAYCNVEQGSFIMTLPAEQAVAEDNIFAKGANPSVGKVEEDATEEYKINSMKNVAALLEFTFVEGTAMNSLTIEGLDGEQLAGGANVVYSDMSWTAGPNPATSVVLTPSTGVFKTGVKYYAAVLPGTLAKGIKITIRDGADGKMVKTFGEESGLTLARSTITNFGEDIDYKEPPKVEEEFVVGIHFKNGWPFKETAVTAPASEGDKYTYNYKDLEDFEFKLQGTYAFTDSKLSFTADEGRIYLPVIEGRYLNSVVIVHATSNATAPVSDDKRRIEIHKAADDAIIGIRYLTHQWKRPVPVAKFSPHSAEQCYLLLTQATDVTDIYLRYNSTAEGTDAVKLGFESQYRNFNNNNGNTGGEGDGSVYLYQSSSNPDESYEAEDKTALSPFVSIKDRTKWGSTAVEDLPNPYKFYQICNGVTYTFEVMIPSTWEENHQRLWTWSNGLWSADYANPNILKLPNTGKLVWAGVACGNSYSAGKNRLVGIWAKDVNDDDYSVVGEEVHMASANKGTADGSEEGNSMLYKMWNLEDDFSATKEYYLHAQAGATNFTCMVLVYL